MLRENLVACKERLSRDPGSGLDPNVRHMRGSINCCHEYRKLTGGKRIFDSVDHEERKVRVFSAVDHPKPGETIDPLPADFDSRSKPWELPPKPKGHGTKPP